MAIARAFAIEQHGTIHNSRRDCGLVHSGQRRPSLVHSGADFASRPDLMVRLGLLFPVLFTSRLSPPAPAQVRQVGSNVSAFMIARLVAYRVIAQFRLLATLGPPRKRTCQFAVFFGKLPLMEAEIDCKSQSDSS